MDMETHLKVITCTKFFSCASGLFVLAALLAGPAPSVHAQSPQAVAIPVVVPSAPGSAPDIIARLLGDELRSRLGVNVVIENRGGGGGIVAVNAARSHASPEALLLAQAAVVTTTPVTYKAAQYDLSRDMEPVAVVAETPMFFVANPSKGPKSLAEALKIARERPDSLLMTSPARGSIPHLSAELLMIATGVRFHMVPMGASAQAIQAVVNGDSLISVDGISPLLPLVRSGRLTAIGVAASRVLPGFEGLPLVRDTVPDFEATGWFMLFAKKGASASRLGELNAAVNAALASPELQSRMQASAAYAVGGSVEQAREFLSREKARWAEAVQRAGIQPE